MFVKFLAPNDNSKNQIYFGPDFQALNLLPHGPVHPDGKRFKAPLDFGWMDNTGRVWPAPSAQLILYPQYPEVRFSGFLRGCQQAPSEAMRSRAEGRVLFIGTTENGKTVGFVAEEPSRVALEASTRVAADPASSIGVFNELPIADRTVDQLDSLLAHLGRIHESGWIGGQILRADGTVSSTDAPNACGYTLEAALGVTANSTAGPDFLGWEIKSMIVKALGSTPISRRITLMTPEPKFGVYKNHGVLEFVRRYGYPAKDGTPDRLNFGGQFRVGVREKNTGLTMKLVGYSAPPGDVTGRINDPKGGLVLFDDHGVEAAGWNFSDLIDHWNLKHARAAYVPAISRIAAGRRSFRYDNKVFLGIQTDFLRFLGTLNQGLVVYDPGIKVEANSSSLPKIKRRSQFRTRFGDLGNLYANFVTRHTTLPMNRLES